MRKRKRTSIIWSLSDVEFQQLLDKSTTKVEMLAILGLSTHSGNHRTLMARIKEGKFNTTKLDQNRNEYFKNHLSSITKIHTKETCLIENSPADRHIVKRLLIKERIIPYQCDKCNNNGEWEGEKLSLQLEHINGINNDNRIENLCFLCPNCHSQSGTFSGKKNKKSGAGGENRTRV